MTIYKKVFEELVESLGEALEHAQGKRELRTTILPAPPAPMDAHEVKRLREQLRASQAVFAHYLNVSTKLVQAWESARRSPDGPALLLLRLAERHPAILVSSSLRAPASKSRAQTTSRRLVASAR